MCPFLFIKLEEPHLQFGLGHLYDSYLLFWSFDPTWSTALYKEAEDGLISDKTVAHSKWCHVSTATQVQTGLTDLISWWCNSMSFCNYLKKKKTVIESEPNLINGKKDYVQSTELKALLLICWHLSHNAVRLSWGRELFRLTITHPSGSALKAESHKS